MNLINVVKMSGITAVFGALLFVALNVQADEYEDKAVVDRIKPPVEQTTGTKAEVNRKPTAQEVAEGLCFNCHLYGGLGAPHTRAEWQKRLGARGFNGIWHSALNGRNKMPKKGGATFLKDGEIRDVIKFMLHHFKVPGY